MRIKKPKKQSGRYLPLEDIEKIDSAFLDEIERVKKRLTGVSDKDLINTFYNVLMTAYSAEIEMQTFAREVDYDVKFAQISERRRNLKPWRRCWLWRLLFRPLTNRAQDIIEERAELDADIEHTAAEKQIEDDRGNLPQVGKSLSKREIKRAMRKKLNEAIKTADNAPVQEAFEEPKADPAQEPSQVQLNLADLPRPRPPRSCRRPPTPKQ